MMPVCKVRKRSKKRSYKKNSSRLKISSMCQNVTRLKGPGNWMYVSYVDSIASRACANLISQIRFAQPAATQT